MFWPPVLENTDVTKLFVIFVHVFCAAAVGSSMKKEKLEAASCSVRKYAIVKGKGKTMKHLKKGRSSIFHAQQTLPLRRFQTINSLLGSSRFCARL